MHIHHLNCISSCPLGGHLMDGKTDSILKRGHLTNHCQLIEAGDELILVDTGFGLNDVRRPQDRLSSFFLNLLKPEFREELTAIRQVEALGYKPQDVRHIILTHLDFDHAGGLDDFPWANVHLMAAEKESAMLQQTWLDRQRYRPAQWRNKSKWHLYEASEGDTWFGFNKVHALEGITNDIALIPLTGHTLGHAGIAMMSKDKWLLNAGDAYFYHKEMDVLPCCTPGLKMYQNMMDKNHKMRVLNQKRLRAMKQLNGLTVDVFCSHDVVEFERIAARSAQIREEMVIDLSQENQIDNFYT